MVTSMKRKLTNPHCLFILRIILIVWRFKSGRQSITGYVKELLVDKHYLTTSEILVRGGKAGVGVQAGAGTGTGKETGIEAEAEANAEAERGRDA